MVTATLVLLGEEAHLFCRVWSNETGVAYRDDPIKGRTWIAYGQKGSPDIEGIIVGGRYLGIEIKTGNAVQQPNQIAWQRMVERFGGYYKVATSPLEALEFVLEVAGPGQA